MTHSRREFLRGTGAVALLGATGGWGSPARAEDPEAITLHARPGTVHLAPPGYPETPIWGYDASVPGPTIRVAHGQRVTRRFVNGLPQPSTVHWHGIRIENSMDGASELTQPPVQPDGAFLYDFEPPAAGTFWYHSHHRAFEQMARGLCRLARNQIDTERIAAARPDLLRLAASLKLGRVKADAVMRILEVKERPTPLARVSPLAHRHINFLGRYAFTLPEAVARGELRPLRDSNSE